MQCSLPRKVNPWSYSHKVIILNALLQQKIVKLRFCAKYFIEMKWKVFCLSIREKKLCMLQKFIYLKLVAAFTILKKYY